MEAHPTTSLCPACLGPAEGRYHQLDGRVHLTRTCPEHGEHDAPVWASADHFLWAQDLFPGSGPAPAGKLAVANDHACLAIVEVTSRCNLQCSYCFASSGPTGEDVPFDEVLHLLDVVAAGGGPRPIQFSGGEPTVRDDLAELVRAAGARGFTHIEVNTNGIVLAEREGYARQLKQAGVTAVYLQFDGLERQTQTRIRGPPLTATKLAAIEACREAGLPVILVCTVVRTINDHELGDIVRFGLDNRDVVRSINFQPVAHFGRFAEDTGLLSGDAVARLVADQVDWLEEHDLLPVPCCSATCQLATAVIPRRDGTGVPLTRFIDRSLWDELSAAVSEDDWMELLAGTQTAEERSLHLASCCGIEVPGSVRELLGDVFPIGITGFMDAEAADVDKLQRCCLAVPTPDKGLVPFCAYNMTTRDGRYALRERFGWGGRLRVS